MSVSLRLPDELNRRLGLLAAKTGRSKTFYMLEAIKRHLDHLEGIYLVEQQLIAERTASSASGGTTDQNKSPNIAVR